MKIKKIKNIILTFVICLFGALAFNSINAKAQTIEGLITANENDLYVSSDGNRKILLYYNPNGADGNQYSVFYYNMLYDNYNFWAVCRYIPSDLAALEPYSYIQCNPPRAAGGFGVISTDNTTFTISWNSTATTIDAFVGTWSDGSQYTFYYSYEDNGGYEEGYDSGYESGRIDGIHIGRDQGYDIGYEDGFDVGYIEGTDNQNTLVGMVGAIFTGPVTMLQSIFNFEILGINFVEMLLGLTTLLVVIWLVKKFI